MILDIEVAREGVGCPRPWSEPVGAPVASTMWSFCVSVSGWRESQSKEQGTRRKVEIRIELLVIWSDGRSMLSFLEWHGMCLWFGLSFSLTVRHCARRVLRTTHTNSASAVNIELTTNCHC